MTTAVDLGNGKIRCFTKGASEVVLNDCTHFINGDGDVEEISMEKISDINTQVISNMTKQAYRTLTIAYKDIEDSDYNSIEDESEKVTAL